MDKIFLCTLMWMFAQLWLQASAQQCAPEDLQTLVCDNRTIKNTVTASSVHGNGNLRVEYVCLEISERGHSWGGLSTDTRLRLRVTFNGRFVIHSVITQSRTDINYWVKEYQVQYGPDDNYIRDSNGNVATFVGNTNKDTPVTNILPSDILTTSVTLLPISWNSDPVCTKFEVMGCDYNECDAIAPCRNGGTCVNTAGSYDCLCTSSWTGPNCELPVQQTECASADLQNLVCDGNTLLNDVTASAVHPGSSIYIGRICLSQEESWVTRIRETNQWVRVAFKRGTYVIHSVITRGRNSSYVQFVSKYRFQYSRGGFSYIIRGANGDEREFIGNTDNLNSVENLLPAGIVASSVTVRQTEWSISIAMRLEIKGCARNECLDNPCQNGGVCINTNGSYECHCQDGFTGPKNCGAQCDGLKTLVCDRQTMLNDVTASSSFASLQTDLACLDSFDINECDVITDSCEYGNPCTNTFGSYSCDCVEGYSGEHCGIVEQCDGRQALVCDNQTMSSNVTASSDHPPNVCLDSGDAWSPSTSDGNQWIRANFSGTYSIYSVITQGHPDNKHWITDYQLQYTTVNGDKMTVQNVSGEQVNFRANIDQNS